jgi:hypothetical protein
VAATVAAEPVVRSPEVEEPAYEYETIEEPIPDKTDTTRGKWCPQCGRPKSVHADVCDYCARVEIERSMQDGSPEYYRVGTMGLPAIGGLFILIAGLLGIAQGVVLLATVADSNMPFTVTCFTSLVVAFGFIALAGSASAMMRKNAVYAILGGIFGVLSIGFYIGAVMGIVGIALVMKSYDEFEVRELRLNLAR